MVHGVWKEEIVQLGLFLLDSEVENDPRLPLISLATFYSKILLLE